MTADLSALIARLEAADAGSHELDKAVAVACGSTINVWAEIAADGTFLGSVRPVTTSLDAALALAERVLPKDTFWEMSHNAVINGQRMYHADVFPPYQSGEATFWGYGATPALALCIAILKARQND